MLANEKVIGNHAGFGLSIPEGPIYFINIMNAMVWRYHLFMQSCEFQLLFTTYKKFSLWYFTIRAHIYFLHWNKKHSFFGF